jgi:DNA-directed RNA polymerase subunit H
MIFSINDFYIRLIVTINVTHQLNLNKAIQQSIYLSVNISHTSMTALSVEDKILVAVFNNLPKLAHYRGMTNYKINATDVIKQIAIDEFVVMEGSRRVYSDEYISYIILIGKGSRMAKNIQEFRKMFTSVVKKPTASKDTQSLIEVLIISDRELSKNIKQTAIDKEIAAEYPTCRLHISAYTYDVFKIVNPEVDCVPKHQLAPKDETEQFFNLLYKKPPSLPRILSSDPAVVWIGGRPGDVIAIDRISESCGTTRVYRLCVK